MPCLSAKSPPEPPEHDNLKSHHGGDANVERRLMRLVMKDMHPDERAYTTACCRNCEQRLLRHTPLLPHGQRFIMPIQSEGYDINGNQIDDEYSTDQVYSVHILLTKRQKPVPCGTTERTFLRWFFTLIDITADQTFPEWKQIPIGGNIPVFDMIPAKYRIHVLDDSGINLPVTRHAPHDTDRLLMIKSFLIRSLFRQSLVDVNAAHQTLLKGELVAGQSEIIAGSIELLVMVCRPFCDILHALDFR